MIEDDRKRLRKRLRQTRRELSELQQHQHALAAARIISRQRIFLNARRIAFYLAEDGELDPSHLIEKAWRFKKQVYLPVLPPTGRALVFAPYDEKSIMKANRFGIDEPLVSPQHWINARQLNLIVMPLVGFDIDGNRLGMGGGYYDRSLSFIQHRKQWHSPNLLGLAHEIQKVPHLACETWDVPLNMIVTEQAIYRGAK